MQNINLNKKLKKEKMIYLILLGIGFIGCIVSLYYPYLIKLNVRSGNLDLPKIKYGYEYYLTSLSLALFPSIFLITVLTKRVVLTFIFSLLNLGVVYLIRASIHFQGFIDHDYDSKTGLGFHLIFSFSILQFILTLIYMIRVIWLINKAAPNSCQAPTQDHTSLKRLI